MKGKKTYLVGALAVASAAVLWWFGAIETGQAATLMFIGLGLASLRHGLTTERLRVLLELVAPYRPEAPEQAAIHRDPTGIHPDDAAKPRE